MQTEWLRLLLMASISTLAVVSVTLLTPPTPEETLVRFFRRVDPPGFWRRTARQAGSDPARPIAALRRGAWLTITMSLSVYLLLIGCGKLLLPAPDASRVVPWALIASGLATVALWWRGVFGRRSNS